MTVAITRLTPAQYADLHDERCQYVGRGKHSILITNSNGLITCDNRGCDLQALHPDYRQLAVARRSADRMARPPLPPVPGRPARSPSLGLVVLAMLVALAICYVLITTAGR